MESASGARLGAERTHTDLVPQVVHGAPLVGNFVECLRQSRPLAEGEAQGGQAFPHERVQSDILSAGAIGVAGASALCCKMAVKRRRSWSMRSYN